jgi:hypothetical protein
MWTYLKRDYLPGRTGSPKMLMVTLSIPDNAFDGLSAAFTEQLTQKYAAHDKKFFQYTIAASRQYLLLRDADDKEGTLFLTDGTLSDQYTDFRQTWLVKHFEEPARYASPELTIENRAEITHGELRAKIELNKRFRDALKYQVRSLKWSRLTAFKMSASYLPAHYLARLTPLRFVNMPKIRTITAFGDRVVLANSAYINTVSSVRIWACEKIIALLEARLRYYNALAKGFSGMDSDASMEVSFPSWYADDISGYWDGAGLPRVIAGTFFSPGAGQARTEGAL